MNDLPASPAAPDAVLPLALRHLMKKVALQPDPQLRFLSMVGLTRTLPQEAEDVVEIDTIPALAIIPKETASVQRERFPRGAGSFIEIDPADQLPRHDLYLLLEDVAELAEESTRQAAFAHIILCILVVPGWVAW